MTESWLSFFAKRVKFLQTFPRNSFHNPLPRGSRLLYLFLVKACTFDVILPDIAKEELAGEIKPIRNVEIFYINNHVRSGK